jgi:hypothetical protein
MPKPTKRGTVSRTHDATRKISDSWWTLRGKIHQNSHSANMWGAILKQFGSKGLTHWPPRFRVPLSSPRPATNAMLFPESKSSGADSVKVVSMVKTDAPCEYIATLYRYRIPDTSTCSYSYGYTRFGHAVKVWHWVANYKWHAKSVKVDESCLCQTFARGTFTYAQEHHSLLLREEIIFVWQLEWFLQMSMIELQLSSRDGPLAQRCWFMFRILCFFSDPKLISQLQKGVAPIKTNTSRPLGRGLPTPRGDCVQSALVRTHGPPQPPRRQPQATCSGIFRTNSISMTDFCHHNTPEKFRLGIELVPIWSYYWWSREIDSVLRDQSTEVARVKLMLL